MQLGARDRYTPNYAKPKNNQRWLIPNWLPETKKNSLLTKKTGKLYRKCDKIGALFRKKEMTADNYHKSTS